jgi:phosphatidylglycerophosphatase A
MKLSWWEKAVVTVLGTGFSPIAPATVASAATCVILWFVPSALRWPGSLTLVPFCFLGVWLSDRAIGAFAVPHDERFAKLRRPDPKASDPDQVVIDEFIGQWLTLLTAPHSILGFTAAFFVFRFFDILKPLGIGALQKARGGWGIMLDDVLAGVYGAILFWLARLLFPAFWS